MRIEEAFLNEQMTTTSNIARGDFFTFTSDLNSDKGPCELSKVTKVDKNNVYVRHEDGDEECFEKSKLKFSEEHDDEPTVDDEGRRIWGLE